MFIIGVALAKQIEMPGSLKAYGDSPVREALYVLENSFTPEITNNDQQ